MKSEQLKIFITLSNPNLLNTFTLDGLLALDGPWMENRLNAHFFCTMPVIRY